jgi:hypothetical protein
MPLPIDSEKSTANLESVITVEDLSLPPTTNIVMQEAVVS